MKTKLTLVILVGFFSFGVIYSCKEDDMCVQPKTQTLDLSVPQSLDKRSNLGRILFYDTRLSVNGAISCATCHQQSLAFSDGQQFSRGFENSLTSRNSPPVQNLGNSFLFWDGRESNLSTMVLKPIVNHVEMGMDNPEALVERVRNIGYYNQLFMDTWNDGVINSERIAECLSEFIQRLQATNSRFKLSLMGQAILTPIESQGQELFNNKYNCTGCHNPESLFGSPYNTTTITNGGFANIGLDGNTPDVGRQAVTNDPADAGKFKIPDLTNVAITAPYMHDGRFNTLIEVLDHYSHGIKAHPNLENQLKELNGQPLQLNISEQEKTAIIAFLNSMTDFQFITNPDFSSPFK